MLYYSIYSAPCGAVEAKTYEDDTVPMIVQA